MSDFVFIIPEGWMQIPADVLGVIDVNRVIQWVQMTDYTSLTDALREQNAIPLDKTVNAAKFFDGEILAVTLG
jgi:hypothetical protein